MAYQYTIKARAYTLLCTAAQLCALDVCCALVFHPSPLSYCSTLADTSSHSSTPVVLHTAPLSALQLCTNHSINTEQQLPPRIPAAGADSHDATSCTHAVPDFTSGLLAASALSSKPLAGKRLGIITETMGEGVDSQVNEAVKRAAAHFESLGAVVEEVSGGQHGG